MSEEAIIIFVKNPIKGKVKTRLAATIGEEKALQVYEQLLRHTYLVTTSLPITRYVFYADFIDPNDRWSTSCHQRLQIDADLGEKMKHAFNEVFEKHNRVVIIGSDCIEIYEDYILQAFESLKEKDMVIGPANDGGYCLLGLRKMKEELFQDIEWSTSTVFRNTLQIAKQNNISFTILPELTDIDTEDDLKSSGLQI